MDIHDIDIKYKALPMTAFSGRPYRTFIDGATINPPRGAFNLASLEKGTLKLPSPFQGFPSLERFCKPGIISLPTSSSHYRTQGSL